MSHLVLSIFPGIGLLDRGFEDEGFVTVRGPDLLWGGDVRRFHPPAWKFEGVIGGPPCQSHSQGGLTARAAGKAVAEDLISEFVRCVLEAKPRWFLMENVWGAPVPAVEGYTVDSKPFNNRSCPDPPDHNVGAEQDRERVFSFGVHGSTRVMLMPRVALWDNPARAPCVTANATVYVGGPKRKSKSDRSTRRLREAVRLQGLPENYDLPGFTVEAKHRAVGNGVPYPLARAVARAVREAVEGGP